MATRSQDAARGSSSLEESRRWRFANAILDERTCELIVDGKEVEIERKPFEVLRVLLRRAGEVVSKDDLLAAVWPGRILSETVLTKCISRLREVLSDESQTIIKTTHGVGYRLIAPVAAEGTSAPAQPPRGKRVMIVDDHEIVRNGVKQVLSDFDEHATFCEATTCEQALALADTTPVDLVLLDYHLPGLKAMDAVRAVRQKLPHATLVVLSGEDDPAIIRQVIHEGAAGFIPKSSSNAVTIAALQLIVAGGVYLPPEAVVGMPAPPGNASHEDPLDRLSHRQVLILRLALQGKTDDLIASELRLPNATVSASLAASFNALGVQNRTEAIFEAARAGLQLNANP
ncbi:MAG TPA: response regulator [Nevskiaceae bacterium]|nr:response regulator [Nevskiaceae bacterium]